MALTFARDIRDDYSRAQALTALARHLPPESLRDYWLEVRTAFLRATPLAACTNLLEHIAPTLPWRWLDDPTRHTAALDAICARGRAGGLGITVEGVLAIDRLLKAGNEGLGITLLPLLANPNQSHQSLDGMHPELVEEMLEIMEKLAYVLSRRAPRRVVASRSRRTRRRGAN